MLNKVEFDNQTEQLMLSKFILKIDPNYPKDALHIFAENNPVHRYNNHMLSLNSNSLYNRIWYNCSKRVSASFNSMWC